MIQKNSVRNLAGNAEQGHSTVVVAHWLVSFLEDGNDVCIFEVIPDDLGVPHSQHQVEQIVFPMCEEFQGRCCLNWKLFQVSFV